MAAKNSQPISNLEAASRIATALRGKSAEDKRDIMSFVQRSIDHEGQRITDGIPAAEPTTIASN